MGAKKMSAQKCVPLCAFFGTFTIVMTVLVLSTDMRPRRRHSVNNGSAEDEGEAQADPRLVSLIRAEYLRPPPPPPTGTPLPSPPLRPLPELAELFGWKRGGVFVEAGAYGADGRSDTEWLESALHWRGLLIQPDPQAFLVLLSRNRSRSHSANVCLSPDVAPNQAVFEGGVRCFPLHSLLLAYNATRVDLLSLHARDPAELQVLKSVAWWRARVRVVSVACAAGGQLLVRLMRLLAGHGYKLNRYASANGRWVFVCPRCPPPRR